MDLMPEDYYAELYSILTVLVSEIGDTESQGIKAILYLLMSAMEIHVEDILLLEMLPISRELLDLAEQAQARMN